MNAFHRMRAALLAASALLAVSASSAQSPHSHDHGFSGAEHWAKVFDDPARDAWQKPHDVIKALALKTDAVIADIGAGTGYFSTRFARMMPAGKIYGVDTERDMVRYLAERAKRESLGNLIALHAAPDNPRIPEKADLIIMVDVYHHVTDRKAYFGKLASMLKPGGRLAIIDFTLESKVGPPRSARIPANRVISELSEAGYSLDQQHAFLPNQYFLVFAPR